MVQEHIASTTEPVLPVAGQVSPTELSKAPEEVAQVVAPVEPTQEEILNQKIAVAVSKALALDAEKTRREIQAANDRSKAALEIAQRRARIAETTIEATQKQLQTLDPETAKEFELAQLRAEKSGRSTLEQEEQAAHYQASIVQTFHENMTQHVVGLGIDLTDKRLDWAGDAPDLLTAQRRIQDSIVRIQKEKARVAEGDLDRKIKEAEARIKKDLGFVEANSVSTAASLGATSSEGIPTDMAKFKEWIAALPQKEYEQKAAKIEEMMRLGKIK